MSAFLSTRAGFLRRFFARHAFALAVLFCLSAGAMFGACSTDSGGGVSLHGVWADGYGGTMEISQFAKTISYGSSDGPNYSARIVNAPDYTAAAGVLIIEFTEYWKKSYGSEPPYALISNDPTDEYNGKFGAVYWRDLTAGSVRLSDAYEGYVHAMFGTIEEAQTKFTLDNAGSYVSWDITSPYTR